MKKLLKEICTGKYHHIVTVSRAKWLFAYWPRYQSICLNFGLSKKYGGYTNLRFDDTNPVTEETEYVESIKDDVRWLGFEWKT